MKITILGVEKTCVGGHKSEMYADALKGAITNSFKKTLGFFGIGKKAYEGMLDDDYRPIPVGTQAKTQLHPTASRKTCEVCKKDYNPKAGTEAFSTKCYDCYVSGKKATKNAPITNQEIPF